MLLAGIQEVWSARGSQLGLFLSATDGYLE